MNFLFRSLLQSSALQAVNRFVRSGNDLMSSMRNLSYYVKFGCPCSQMKKMLKQSADRIPKGPKDCKRDLVKISAPKKIIKPSADVDVYKKAVPRYGLSSSADIKLIQKWQKRMNKRINRPKKALKLRGSNAAITGGFGSIGKAACISMLERGIASLGILDIRENKSLLEALRRRYPEKQIYYHPIDVTNRYSVAEAFNVVGDKVKNLDVFINSSGVLCDGCPEKTIGVNLLGTVYTTLAAMERMGRHNGGKGGTIVNIASVLGLVPCNAFAIYSSSKHGQVGFTRSLADDFYFKRTGVKLMLVCPGMTNTDLTRDPEGSTTFPYAAILGRHLVTAESQSAEICAENMVRAMEKNKNGSVWILDVGKYYEVRPVQYWIPVYNESNNSPEGVKDVD